MFSIPIKYKSILVSRILGSLSNRLKVTQSDCNCLLLFAVEVLRSGVKRIDFFLPQVEGNTLDKHEVMS